MRYIWFCYGELAPEERTIFCEVVVHGSYSFHSTKNEEFSAGDIYIVSEVSAGENGKKVAIPEHDLIRVEEGKSYFILENWDEHVELLEREGLDSLPKKLTVRDGITNEKLQIDRRRLLTCSRFSEEQTLAEVLRRDEEGRFNIYKSY